MKRPDVDVVRSCLDGRPEDFEELIRVYYRPVYAYIISQVGNKTDAEDLTQETFLNSFASLNKCKNPSAFSSWLFSIARNRCLLWLREKKRQKAIIDALADYPKRDENEGVAHLDALREVFPTLPEEYQQVLLLKYQNNMSCSEIAQVLQRPVGTITSILTRAYRHLKEGIRKYEV
jgi:RNA polymerase sigma-70 factor (ECF subfamily)